MTRCNQLTVTIDPTSHRTTTLYDLRGLATEVTDGSGNPTQNTYNSQGWLMSSTTGSGSAAITSTNSYNNAGWLTGSADGAGDLTTYSYDAVGRLTLTATPGDDEAAYTANSYNAGGEVTEISEPDNQNSSITYLYDGAGRVTSQTSQMGSGYSTTTFAYNGLGLETSTTDALGRVEDFYYDAQDRMTGQVWYNAGGTVVYDRLTSTYDASGDLLTAANGAGTYTMTYNALNEITSVMEPNNVALSFAYDAAGDRTQMQEYAGGLLTGTVASTFDAYNRLTETLLTSLSGAEAEMDVSYTGNGMISTESRFSYPERHAHGFGDDLVPLRQRQFGDGDLPALRRGHGAG